MGHKDTQAHRCIGAQTQRHRDRETDIHLLTRHGPKLNEVCKEPATACLKRHALRLFKERRKLRHLHRHTHIRILPGILSLNTRMAVLRCMLSFNDYCDVRCRSMASDTSWIDTGFATVDDVKKRTTKNYTDSCITQRHLLAPKGPMQAESFEGAPSSIQKSYQAA